MKTLYNYLFLASAIFGLLTFSSCGDDDEPVPEDPTLSLTPGSLDANRGQQIMVSGTLTAPGGFAELTASVSGITVTGLTTGSVEEQNFTATYTVPADAALNESIDITFTAEDNLGQTGQATFSVNVVALGAPTIAIATGSPATADLKRREVATIELNISAPEGIDELVVTDASSNVIATVDGASITDPANFSWDYTIPDEATPGEDIVLNHNVTDNIGRTTTTAAVFTVSVLEFDPVTIAFKDLESPVDTAFNEAGDVTITLAVTKDALVSFDELAVATSVNGGDITVSQVDVSGETGDEIDYNFTVSQVFNDNVDLTLNISDEFGVNSDNIEWSYFVLTTSGATYLIDDFDVNGNSVKRIRGTITENETLMAANDYYLSGEVEVSGATLTVEAGSTVYAESGVVTQLQIDEDAAIIADGTAVDPIVFTSGATLEGGTQEPGDWAGLRFDGADGANQGTLNYVRIEYGGTDDAALRLNTVDNSTSISFVQIHASVNLGIEARAGTVHLSNIFVTSAGGSSIELDDNDGVGYDGTMQFILIESSEILEKGARDFEIRDGSNVLMSNVTMIASGKEETAPVRDVSAVRVRDDAGGHQIYNMLIAEYSDDGFRFDPVGADTNLGGVFFFANSYIFRIGDDPTRDDSDPDNLPLIFETSAGTYSNTIDKDNVPAAAAGIGVADFVPDAEITTNAFDPTTLGAPFVAATYVGAIGTTDWTLGWTLNADSTPR